MEFIENQKFKPTIESPQNPNIKQLALLLAKNSVRRASDIFVVEGKQENSRALQFGFLPKEFFICEKYFTDKIPQNAEIHFVSEKIYEKIAYRGTTEGIIGIYQIKNADIQQFTPAKNSKIIVIESVEKPGNLGAILRSCEAFGIDAVVVTDCKTDFYNPNVIRSSVGCLFGTNFFTASNEILFNFLQKNSFRIFTTFMSENAELIQNLDLQGRTALVFGTEHSGLSNFWHSKGKNCLIPMRGTVDSLNLSNAVAIACYEFERQRIASQKL
ncbi:rRNA methyltransferase [Bacteroidia bacterium]|nr:rRNA methyltransferase [Bacteroidia bacterium]GHV44660.1 rRNA methyltransferase [Bacteroidia bacterium]